MSTDADETQALQRHDRPASRQGQEVLTEVLRIVQQMNAKIDRQDKELVDIKLRLERGAASIEASNRDSEDLRSVRDKLIVLDTRFAIIWAGIGIAAASGITGAVMASIALLKH